MTPPVGGGMSIDELGRRLDEALRRLDDIARDVREDRKELANTYLRADLYRAEQQGLRADMGEMKSGIEENAKWRRQVWLAVSVALIGVVGALAASLLTLAHTR